MRQPLLSAIALAASMSLPAQTTAPSDRPTIAAVRRHARIIIDGRLDEAEWTNATPAGAFLQHDPSEGMPATQRTEVRFLYDDNALYIAARMFDSEGASGVQTRLARRDDTPNADYIMFVLDTYHDHAGRTVLRVDPSGVKFDALGLGRADPDASWDGVWDVATRIDSLGWTAEFRIPFAELRLAASGPQTWGMQIWRYEQRLNEMSQWSFWTKTDAGGPPSFGHLTGIAPSRAAMSIVALPYASVGVAPEMPGTTPHTNAARTGAQATLGSGGDLLFGVPGARATLTINPDFGQVEADPAVVNLTAVETFFPEKRPFFVQDAGIFSFGGVSCLVCGQATPLKLYYSRRVGRPPTLPPTGATTEEASAARILGAMRLTAQSRNGWTIGALAARTGQMDAQFLDSAGLGRYRAVEPATTYALTRAERRSSSGELSLGIMGTIVERALGAPSSDTLASILPSRAATGGTDLDWWWAGHTYHLTATAALSSVRGDSLALRRIQLSSVHYFQRAGRSSSTGPFDSQFNAAREQLNGYGGVARFAKDAGPWTWEGIAESVSPGLEANDFGFVPVSGVDWFAANLRRSFNTPHTWYHSADMTIGAESATNFDGDATSRAIHIAANVTTPAYWTLSTVLRHLPAHYDDRLLRGGPTVAILSGDSTEFDIASDARMSVSAGMSSWWASNRSGNRDIGAAPTITVRPTDALALSGGLRAQWLNVGSQFIAAVPGMGVDPAIGQAARRFVVAAVHQRILSSELRIASAVTSTLSVDLYAQALLAGGTYRDFGEFAAPRSSSRLDYGRDIGTLCRTTSTDGSTTIIIDPDGAAPAAEFRIQDPTGSTRSLRGTAVLRWEYRPGSAIILAWTQTRLSVGSDGGIEPWRDSDALFATPPQNAFVLKSTYRIER